MSINEVTKAEQKTLTAIMTKLSKGMNVDNAAQPFVEHCLKEQYIRRVDEESTYVLTNRGHYVLSMSDSDAVEEVTDNQKKTLIIMSLMDGEVTDNQKKTLIIMSLMDGKASSADNSFNPHMFCDFEDLITKKFVMTDRDSDNLCPFAFWLSKKGEQFVKKHCIIL